VIAANALLQKGALDDALLALLAVWQKTREPRVAALIDLVSVRLVPAVEPMPGKTVEARDDAWRALAKKKSPRDVPRLLAALWPKQWRDARPLLDLLDRFPDDPRIAAFLTRTVVEPPYTSKSSFNFSKLVFASIGRLGDRRGLEALATSKEALAKTAIAQIERRAIAPVDETALAAAEAYFAGDIARASADTDRGAALLAAVYEAPDDDGPRAVYADWLVERGDKRGEFIALQLARGDGEPTKRERELEKEHGRAWAGELGKAFGLHDLVFDRGFFAGGPLHKEELARLRDDPAARLVTTLRSFDAPETVLAALAHLPSLRDLTTTDAVVAALAKRGEPLQLTTLAVSLQYWASTRPSEPDASLARLEVFPALRNLSVTGDHIDKLPWLVDAPVLDRIAHARIGGNGLTRQLVASLVRRAALRSLQLYRYPWTATLTRTTPNGPFEACRLETTNHAYGLDSILDVLPSDLTSIDIDLPFPIDPERKARLDPALARFTAAKIVIPHMPPPVLADAPVLQVRISGRGFLDPDDVESMWSMLAEVGQTYDSFVVGDGKAIKPLGDDPLARIAKWAANEKTEKLALRHSERRDRALLYTTRPHPRFGQLSRSNEIDLVTRAGIEGIPSLFVQLVKRAGSDWALCDVIDRPWTFVHFDNRPIPLGWLSLVRAEIADQYPIDTIEGDGITLLRDGVTIIKSAPAPSEVTPDRIELVRSRLRAIGGV
jgi:uncharacterized protein (TIGR02996 family)